MDRRKRKLKELADQQSIENGASKRTLRARARDKKVNYAIDDSDSQESEIQTEKPTKKAKRVRNKKKNEKGKRAQKKRKQSSDSDFELDGRFEESENDEDISDVEESESIESEILSEVSSGIKGNKSKQRKQNAKLNNKNSSFSTTFIGNQRPMHTSKFIPSTVRIAEDNKINADAGISINDMGGLEDAANLEIPQFIKKDFIRDKNMRRPDDPEYDHSSVHIPEEEFKKLTPLMRQYWSVKQDYYDSIVLVRMAQWYTVFYYDIIALNLLSNSHLKLSACMEGFYGTQKDKYIKLFTDNNYKVVVFEQTENVSTFLSFSFRCC
jgi:DNA mismatch repair protein MSH6